MDVTLRRVFRCTRRKGHLMMLLMSNAIARTPEHTQAQVVVVAQMPRQTEVRSPTSGRVAQGGAAHYFVRGTQTKILHPLKKRFNAHTSDVILLFDSAETEYEVD